MKPLTLEETALKEEMKERCLAKGKYKDENAKAKFGMLCHLEDFEVQYWELQQENKHLDWVNCHLRKINKQLRDNIRQMDNSVDKLQKQLIKEKDNWNELKKYIKTEIPEEVFIDTEWFVSILDKMLELEQRTR